VIAPIDDAWLGRVARTPEDRALLKELEIRSMLSVPLSYQGQEIGSITLFYGPSGRVHTERDLALADELARRAAAALVNARLFKEAQEAIGVRDDFLSMAGHELRTPLTALQLQILSISKMLSQPDALEKIGARAEKAGKNVLRLSNLVNELLDISRISAGRLRLERSTVQLADAVRAVITRHDEELTKSGCAISFVAKQNPSGSWDRARIEQIVSSFIVNATKYGKGKPIEVSVDQGEGVARLTVRDHGIGVSPEDQERIFQRFERAVSSRHFGGLGLGLWIARQLVDAHGGTIRLSSEQDRGATFEVELPLAPLDEVQA
jgi:signal transduction histidine kinase